MCVCVCVRERERIVSFCFSTSCVGAGLWQGRWYIRRIKTHKNIDCDL